MADSSLLSHGPCADCGSSDGCALYDDGHTYCFVCERHTHGDGEVNAEEIEDFVPEGALVPIEIRDIPARGLTTKTCRRYGYGVASGHQVAQYRNATGQVVAQKYRSKDKRFWWTGEKSGLTLFGQHLSRGGGKHLIITEGEIDALTMDQVQGNRWACVSVPNGASGAADAILAQLSWVESFDRVVICFDQDEPGQKAAVACAALLAPGKASIMHFDGKDPSELLQAGRTAELVQAFWDAIPYRPDGLMGWTELWQEVSTEDPPPSIEWNVPGIQEKTGGIRDGEIITIAAGPAAGKTTFCAELATYLVSEGYRVGYISLEQNKRATALSLLTPLVDRPLLREEPIDFADEDLIAAQAKLAGNVTVYRHCGRLDAGALEEKARFMAKGDGCKFIFLDNLSVVVSSSLGNSGDRQLVDEIMQRLVGLVQETDVTIFLVVHLRRPGSQGEGYSQGRVPRMEEVRGSGMIEAFSHTMIGLARDQEAATPTETHVLKCRITGSAGFAGTLVYNYKTGRLQPGAAGAVSDFTPVEATEDF